MSKLDDIRRRARTLDYDRKQKTLLVLESFQDCFELGERHHLYSEIRPQPKQGVATNKRYAHYVPAKKKEYMKKMLNGLKATYGLRKPPIEGPILLTVLYSFPWTSDYKKASKLLGWLFNTKRPDVDNLLKPLKDCMSGTCYRDDSQIVGVHAYKIRTDRSFVAVLLDEIKEISVQPFALTT